MMNLIEATGNSVAVFVDYGSLEGSLMWDDSREDMCAFSLRLDACIQKSRQVDTWQVSDAALDCAATLYEAVVGKPMTVWNVFQVTLEDNSVGLCVVPEEE